MDQNQQTGAFIRPLELAPFIMAPKPAVKPNILVIGAGNVGMGLYAMYLNNGHQAMLLEDEAHPGMLRELKGDRLLEAMGPIVSGIFPVITSTSLANGLAFADLLVLTIPSFAQEAMMRRLAAYDLSKHCLVHIIGNLVSISERHAFKPEWAPLYQFELSTSPIGTRIQDGKIFVKGVKHRLLVASWPIQAPEEVCAKIESVLPQKPTWFKNVLDVFAVGVAPMAHVVTAIHSLAWSEATKGDFYFYGQAMASPSVAKLINKLRKEWNDVLAPYDCPSEEVVESFNKNYDTDFHTMEEFAANTVTHNMTKGAPKNANHRYTTQDIPFGLVTIADLGHADGKHLPLTMSYIAQGDGIHDADFMKTGRKLVTPDMGDNVRERILEIVNFKRSA